MAHDTSDLLSFYLKQQQAYLACKAHLVREYCHQAHSGHVPCRICTLECFLVIHSYLILICCWFTARGSSKTTGVHGVVQGDPERFGGSSPGLPFPCSPFPVGTAMLCLPSGLCSYPAEGTLAQSVQPPVRARGCNLLQHGLPAFLGTPPPSRCKWHLPPEDFCL